MKKRYLTMLMVCLFFVGCAGNQVTTTAAESPFMGGNQGLIAEFLEMGIHNDASGMEEIFEDETFPIEVMVKNKGEQDVAAGDITISLKGISLDDFSGIDGASLSNSDAIESVSEFNKQGGEATIDFTSGAQDAQYTVAITGSHYDAGVFGEVVYTYATHASVPKVCFKEDLQTEGICEVDEAKTVFSSAAPIQVKSAAEKRAGTGKIAVEFEVENVGGGDVTKPGDDFDSRYDQLAFVSGEEDLWECKAGGKLNEGRFDSNNKVTIVCKLKDVMADDTLYTKELDLTLNYDYRTLIQRSIRIRKQ